MATLVLTTVGGAIGGPVGAALGAVVGQAVDRRVLAPRARQGPRLSELKVQTSSYGTQIPRMFGRLRVAGCVIWATDLIEQRTGRSGKGQPSVTSYSYAASFAVALSARRIAGVARIWADGKLLRGAAGDWKVETGFRLYHGDEAQAPDPLIAATLEPGTAPAHRGIAYAVFEMLQLAEFGNRIPSLTFEVIADTAPVRVGDIARAIGDGALVGAGPDDPVHGFAASGDTIAAAAETLAALSGGWFAADGGGVKLSNRVDAPRVLVARTVSRTRAPIDRVPASVQVSHYDPARDYQIGVQRAVRPGGGTRGEDLPVAAALEADEAKALALSTLLARERLREVRQVVADVRAIAVAPGMAVSLNDDHRVWRVTRSSVEGTGVSLDLVPVTRGVTARAADAGRVLSSPDVSSGRSVVEAFELPPTGDELWTSPRVAIAAAGDAPGWRQAALAVSRDNGATWEAIGGTAAPAVIGRTRAAVRRGSATLVDRASIIEIALLHDGMTLESADAALLGRGGNLALLGDEVIQFAIARQVAPARWHLSVVSRGLNGTAAEAHPAGARFVLLARDTLLVLPAGSAQVGDQLVVAARGVGDRDVPAQAEVAVDGRSVAPLAPVHLDWHEVAGGGGRISWVRRSRLGWQWRDGEVPLAEETEGYLVTVEGASATREVLTTDAFVLLSAAERAGGRVRVSVRQLGALAQSRAATIVEGE